MIFPVGVGHKELPQSPVTQIWKVVHAWLLECLHASISMSIHVRI